MNTSTAGIAPFSTPPHALSPLSALADAIHERTRDPAARGRLVGLACNWVTAYAPRPCPPAAGDQAAVDAADDDAKASRRALRLPLPVRDLDATEMAMMLVAAHDAMYSSEADHLLVIPWPAPVPGWSVLAWFADEITDATDWTKVCWRKAKPRDWQLLADWLDKLLPPTPPDEPAATTAAPAPAAPAALAGQQQGEADPAAPDWYATSPPNELRFGDGFYDKVEPAPLRLLAHMRNRRDCTRRQLPKGRRGRLPSKASIRNAVSRANAALAEVGFEHSLSYDSREEVVRWGSLPRRDPA